MVSRPMCFVGPSSHILCSLQTVSSHQGIALVSIRGNVALKAHLMESLNPCLGSALERSISQRRHEIHSEHSGQCQGIASTIRMPSQTSCHTFLQHLCTKIISAESGDTFFTAKPRAAMQLRDLSVGSLQFWSISLRAGPASPNPIDPPNLPAARFRRCRFCSIAQQGRAGRRRAHEPRVSARHRHRQPRAPR